MSSPFRFPNESNDFYRDPRKADKDYHFESDVDSSLIAKHHTLGTRRNQASPGNHSHLGTDGSFAGARILKGAFWSGSLTDVTSASATFVEHSSFSISSVPLTTGVMYRFVAQIGWFKSGGTAANTNTMQVQITQNTVGGTVYSGAGTFVQYLWSHNSGAGATLYITIPWLHTLASSTDDVIFSFARSGGDGSTGVRAKSGLSYSYIEAMGQDDTRMFMRSV